MKANSNVKKDIPLKEIPKVWWKLATAKDTNILKRVVTLGVPLIIAPLFASLIARRAYDQDFANAVGGNTNNISDDDKKKSNKKKGKLKEFFAKAYPVIFTTSLGLSILNSTLFASPSRLASYASLFGATALNSIPEYTLHKDTKKINDLRESLNDKTLNEEEKKKIQDEIDKLRKKISNNIGSLVLFAKIGFPLLMNFTFWSQACATDPTGKYTPTMPKSQDLGGFFKEFGGNFKSNLKKEWGIFSDVLIHRIPSKESWSHIWQTFKGKNIKFERENIQGKNLGAFGRLTTRLRIPEFATKFFIINMIIRNLSAALIYIATKGWSYGISDNSNNVFLINDPRYYENDTEIKKLREAGQNKKKYWKMLFDVANIIGNISLFTLGVNGMLANNPAYRASLGQLAGLGQSVGGGLQVASAVADQMGYYLPANTLRISSSSFFQLSNLFGAINGDILKGLTMATVKR